MPLIKTRDFMNTLYPNVKYEGLGSVDFWKDFYSQNKLPSVSLSDDEPIVDLREHIATYGDTDVNVFYYEEEGMIVFYDFLDDEELTEYGLDEDLSNKKMIKMKSTEALKYFIYQTEIK